MLQVVNTSQQTGGPVTPGPGPYVVNGSNGNQVSVFNCTAMDLSANGSTNTVAQQAARTSSTCYMRGFSESIRLQTSTPLTWFWRRTVFRSRFGNLDQYSATDTPTNTTGPSYTETSNGMQRLYMNLTVNASNQTITNIQGLVFKGQVGTDWVDPHTAPIDTTRVDLVSDKRVIIRSGNQSGTVREFKFWHPYNGNLVYDDDESGAAEADSYRSVSDNRGKGNMYILDMFQPAFGSTSSDLLAVTSTATLYWHEK